jgi:pyruvate formate lyase activating enzyme
MKTAEETPVYAFLQQPSLVDFPGRLAAVFFTSGCNFSCGFCHNAPLMGRRRKGLSRERVAQACAKFKADWVTGVVISGGEPTLHKELPGLIRFFKEAGLAVKLDTNGSHPDRLARCLPLVDYVAMDIKTGLSGYPELTGWTETERIERSIELIKTEAAAAEFRTTVIEPLHTDEQMDEVAELVRGAPRYVLQPFLPRESLADPVFERIPRTSPQRLETLRRRMQDCAAEVIVRGA